jgi:hypothetical protein
MYVLLISKSSLPLWDYAVKVTLPIAASAFTWNCFFQTTALPSKIYVSVITIYETIFCNKAICYYADGIRMIGGRNYFDWKEWH